MQPQHTRMCGIAGHYRKNLHASLPDFSESVLASLADRGPDGKGFLKNERTQFFHSRLGIIAPVRRRTTIHRYLWKILVGTQWRDTQFY